MSDHCATILLPTTKENKVGKTYKDNLVRANGGVFMLNQHAPKFADKRTKRNRSRTEQNRRAIAEQN